MKILYNLILLLLITANGFSQSRSKTPVSGKDDFLLDTSNPPVGTMRDKSGGGGFRVQSVSPVISFTEFPINHNMHITSDGNYFYTINGGNAATGQVNKFSLTGTLLQTYPIMIDGRGFSYNPADSFLYVSTYLGNILRIDNLAAGTFTQIYSGIMQNGQASFALSADGTLFYDFYAGTLIIRNFGNGAV